MNRTAVMRPKSKRLNARGAAILLLLLELLLLLLPSARHLSINLYQARDFHRAIERAREALNIYKATLPPSHPNIQKAQQLVRLIEGDLVRRA